MRDSSPDTIESKNRASSFIGSMIAALALLLFVITLSDAAARENEQPGTFSAASVRVLVADEKHISFALETPTTVANLPGAILDVPGLDQRTTTTGTPAVPYFSTYIVIPPDSQPRVSADSLPPVIQTGVFLPAVTPEPVLTPPMLGEPVPGFPAEAAPRAPGAGSVEKSSMRPIPGE